MHATSEDLQALIEIQAVDLELAGLGKQLESLPQRATILEARKKRSVLDEKMGKIASLKKEASKKLNRIEDEDASLLKKEAGVQAAIEAAGNDFRNAEARAKELDGISRRRRTLAEDRKSAKAEYDRITGLEEQVESALAELDHAESRAIESFKVEGSAINEAIGKRRAQKDALLSMVDYDVADLYEKTSKIFDTVFIGRLEGSRCSVCRTSIDAGRLIQIRNDAPLTTCPSCKRLLIVDAS